MVKFSEYFTVVLYGIIQAVLAIPVMYGYAAIVFSDPVYSTFMPALAKLMLFSSFIHGVCFCVRSNIPFAIGQVQDAGLIFLSKIASDIATRMKGEDPASVVATSLVCIALCTAALGVLLILIGRVKLAKFVSYLPMPVIGGYLAYIGYFCLEAGLSLASGEVLSGLSSWRKLIMNDRTVILCIPAMVSGAALTLISRKFDHFAALPSAIVFIPTSFYLLLWLTNNSFDDAREYGWLGPMTEPADSLEIFTLYDFSSVNWSVIPYQLPVWAAMVVVVAFSSCLDVAAIEMDMGTALDTNAELITVGSSNLLSGLTGGFTGSYIFSQTIFGFRSGVHLRSVAGVMLILEIIVFGLKIDPLAYVPLFFFAATLIFIAIDLMLEWLLEVRAKLSMREYLTVLSTFIAINIIGLNPGLFFGVCLSIVDFVFTYALSTNHKSSNMVTRIVRQSLALRHPSQMRCLKENSGAIATFELRGSAFFGSSVDILQSISSQLNLPSGGTAASAAVVASAVDMNGGMKVTASDGSESRCAGPADCAAGKVSETSRLLASAENGLSCYHGDFRRSPVVSEVPVQFVVLDCQYLQGVDATAARSCFRQLQNLAQIHDIRICYAGCSPRVITLLRAHGALVEPTSREFSTLYAALDWCETTLLNDMAEDRPDLDEGLESDIGSLLVRRKSLRKVPRLSVALVCKTILGLTEEESEELKCLKQYSTAMTLETNEFLFRKGDPASAFYVLLEGNIVLETEPFEKLEHRAIKFQKGAFLGYVDMNLLSTRKYHARALAPCMLAEFSEHALEQLQENDSRSLTRLLQVLVCDDCLTIMIPY